MEKMNLLEMTDEALHEARIAAYGKIEALPARFPISGYEVCWEERSGYNFVTGEDGHSQMVNYPTLYIKPTTRDYHHDLNIEIKADGTVKNYSFFSSSGNNEEEAAETAKYYQACLTLLSKEFRDTVIQDYKNKLASLEALKAEYEAIGSEQARRKNKIENERKAKEEKEAAERHIKAEAIGQVWYDYNYSDCCRYTVKSVTEKTITFDVWFFLADAGRWVIDGSDKTKRISKHLLGKKPTRRRRDCPKVMVCPVGTDDLNSQKIGRPETIGY
jgi:hypothetical protein